MIHAVTAAPVHHAAVLHERHTPPPPGWHLGGPASPDQLVHVTVAVKYPRQSVKALERELLLRSDPVDHQTTYGQWLTLQQVDHLIAPHPSSVAAVRQWLNTSDVSATANAAFLSTAMTASQFERRVGQPLQTYRHATTGRTVLRLPSDCWLPSSVAAHVDILSPSVARFPPQGPATTNPNPIPTPPIKITPSTLRNIYNMTDEYGVGNHSNNTQAITNFLGQYVQQSDLDHFFDTFAPNVSLRTPLAVVGDNHGHDPGVEAMLDSEYLMSVGAGVSTEWWFTQGAQPGDPSDEPWLKWLFTLSNTTNIPMVFSASYTDFEEKVDLGYSERVNIELMKLGIRGTSLLMAAGDYGIGTLFSQSSGYQPEFPVGSPWVTAVGGTMLGDKKTSLLLEEAWNDNAIGGGGGFSNRFARPSYQDHAVAMWYNISAAEGKLPANASLWNSTGRAYPDVAALATPYQTICSGFVQIGTGTSASTPTMAGVISLLNEHRLSAGKTALGFLNPLIHKVLGPAGAFRDVDVGSIPGFYDHSTGKRSFGFNAVRGFDPATGWGTPNFPALLTEVLKLP